MGRPIGQSYSEIEKTAWACDYYAESAPDHLKPEPITIDAQESYVQFDPLGVVLHIAPWNFPFWLVLRPVVPAILAGNTVVMKHASNVPQCSLAIDGLFQEAGFPEGVFQSLLVSSPSVEQIIQDEAVRAVTLIGSGRAGQEVASVASRGLKKTVMELGGSDPFIVLKDADLDKVIPNAHKSRLRNTGQACNAAKRFIVEEEIAEEFVARLKESFQSEVIGDPMDETTTFGPLGNLKTLEKIEQMVQESVDLGAEIVLGGKRVDRPGYYYEPTILTKINKYMPVYQEETFGPIAPVIVVQSVEEAVQVANDSKYGLGATIWTENYELGKSLIPKIEAGNVYINSMLSSHPKMPYGGVKDSGYGRELGKWGFQELTNVKSVVVK
jgi:succinate-semialdehyde dehydrogenase/glutarate-semialdehyde dehydrogenase